MFNIRQRFKMIDERFKTVDRIMGAVTDLLIDKGIISRSEVQKKIMENALKEDKHE